MLHKALVLMDWHLRHTHTHRDHKRQIRYLQKHNRSYMSSVTFYLPSNAHTHTHTQATCTSIKGNWLLQPSIVRSSVSTGHVTHQTHTADLSTLIIDWGSDLAGRMQASYPPPRLRPRRMIRSLRHCLRPVYPWPFRSRVPLVANRILMLSLKSV